MNLAGSSPTSVRRQLVAFRLDGRRYALYLEVVDRVFPVAQITPLPKSPDVVLGVINLQGEIVPVFNVRKRFRMGEREPALNDHLLVAQTSRRSVALLVDEVEGLVDCETEEVVGMSSIVADGYIEGVVKLPDGMVLIHDLDRFLSLEESSELEKAIEEAELEK